MNNTINNKVKKTTLKIENERNKIPNGYNKNEVKKIVKRPNPIQSKYFMKISVYYSIIFKIKQKKPFWDV